MEDNLGYKLGQELGKSITEGDIENAIFILHKLNQMDVEIKFSVVPKFNPNQGVSVPQLGKFENEYRLSDVKDDVALRQEYLSVQLQGMGMTKEQINYGLQRASTLEGAIEIIYAKQWD